MTLSTIASSVAPSSTSAALGIAANCDPGDGRRGVVGEERRAGGPASPGGESTRRSLVSWPFTSERSRPVTMIPVASPIAATASAVFVRASSENHVTEATDGASASAIALASACAVPVLS